MVKGLGWASWANGGQTGYEERQEREKRSRRERAEEREDGVPRPWSFGISRSRRRSDSAGGGGGSASIPRELRAEPHPHTTAPLLVASVCVELVTFWGEYWARKEAVGERRTGMMWLGGTGVDARARANEQTNGNWCRVPLLAKLAFGACPPSSPKSLQFSRTLYTISPCRHGPKERNLKAHVESHGQR